MEASELLKRYELVKKYTEGERNFVGINLNEANLSRINLSQANLSQASLFITNLSGANLSEANLSEANLNVARLSSANFSRAILNQASLNVANLVRADLSDAQLIEVSMIRGELIRAELSRANFTRANLSGADLREAKLTQANLSYANLSGANLRGASGVAAILEQIDLHGADLTKADLRDADLRNSELRQANLSQANLSGADLSGANLRWADLSGANLSGADLSDAKFSGANLYGANLSNANLGNASLVHADLTHTTLIGADWDGADLSGATLTGVKIYEVPRFGLKAEEVTCEWVDLSPYGDHSELLHFQSSDEAKKFFNHTLPTVQILVDSPLDQAANLILATTYYQIAQLYPMMIRPPSIEAGYRRTILTFKIDSNVYLLPVTCIAILPFKDAAATQKNILNLIKILQHQFPVENPTVYKILTAMNEAITKVNDIKKVLASSTSEQTTQFFQSPTQVILTNSSETDLIAHVHQFFGKRVNNDEAEAEISYQNNSIKSHKFMLPTVSQLVNFIEGFYDLN